MNVFLIPSWYPSKASPLDGCFTAEQARAIGETCPDIHVIVSTWGHADGQFRAGRPATWYSARRWYLDQSNDVVADKGWGHEVFNPAVTPSNLRLPYAMKNLLRVNRRNLRVAMREFGPMDLLHAHVSFPAGYIAAALSADTGLPYVLTEHMSPFPFPALMKGGRPIPEIRTAFNSATHVVAVSDSLAKSIASYDLGLAQVIPNLVDEQSFLPGAPAPGRFTFFTLCTLTAQKGLDTLLKAIALWKPSADQVDFRIGGTGPLRDELIELARELGISDRITWLGFVDRATAPRFFRECNAFVLPSRHETFGVVFAEALATGKPVIATRCGGPESFIDASNGLLVDVDDPSGLAEAMTLMARSWSDYDPSTIRSGFESRFSRAVVSSSLRDLYMSTVGI